MASTSTANKRLLDVVFEGGGARGLVLNGAIAELEKHGFGFNRLVGTSAGAIAATLVAAGYTGEELRALSMAKTPEGHGTMTKFIGTPGNFTDEELLSSALGTFFRKMSIPFVPKSFEEKQARLVLKALLHLPLFPNLFSLVERNGYYSADGFLEFLRDALDAGGRQMSGLNFAQLYERTGHHLSLVVTDTDQSSMLVLNHITAPACPVLFGVRMSMSIPFFWPDVAWDPAFGSYQGINVAGNGIVDGGVASNFALRLLVSDEPWVTQLMGGPPDPEQEILGLYLDATLEVPDAPPPAGQKGHAGGVHKHPKIITQAEKLLDTMLSSGDLDECRAYPELVCHLPTKGYGSTEFNMSTERIEALLRVGAVTVDAWLKTRGKLSTVCNARASIPTRPPQLFQGSERHVP